LTKELNDTISVRAALQPVECENTSAVVVYKIVHLDTQILIHGKQTAWHGHCGGILQVHTVRAKQTADVENIWPYIS
jgi:hypothetical protein